MAIGKISEPLKAYPDYFLDGVDVPNNTTTTSGAVQVGGTQGELMVQAVAASNISIANTKTLVLKVQTSDSANSGFADKQTLYSATASGTLTIDAGTVLGEYIFTPSDKMYAKVTCASTDSASIGSVDAYLTRVCR